MKRRIRLIACFAVLLAIAPIAGAQTLDSGQLRGTVYDESKSPLPGATVTLSNAETGFSRVVVTSASGAFQFPQIPTGSYEMLVQLDGFNETQVTDLVVNVGASLTFDVSMTLGAMTETITVVASSAPIDTSSAGFSQLISEKAIENLPLLGRDFRDLARLSPSAQVTPGLRGGLRLGGQQSDYSGLSIDGADGRDNFFGEFFGSLETKNSVIPIEAVQEFQVVTNGFAPEFGRSTGGLLNVVTKSGTNEVKGSAHWFHRNESLTEDDWLGTPPNIDSQNQFGAAVGGPLVRDKQFFLVAFDISDRDGPLVTQFARDVSGVSAPELGISDLGSLQGTNTQSQELLSILGKWDIQMGDSDRLSIRSFYTENKTNGFTGGRGQNQIQASFGNTEKFENSGHNTIATWNKVTGDGSGSNELKVMYSDQKRPREPNATIPEINILDTGTFGQRFFLPIQGDNEKITVQENFQYAFGNHDVKFGADINAYSIRNNLFFGWSAGSYSFFTLEDFQAGTPFGFIQGFGINEPYAEAAIRTERAKQTAYGLYIQDKWQAKPNLTVSYGLRWDGTDNPSARSSIGGQQVLSGVGADAKLVSPPQEPPSDFEQWGPRLGASYSFDLGGKAAVLRGSWGLYYAQTPTIFHNQGSGNTAVTFCFFNPTCIPPGGYPNLWPDSIDPNSPLAPQGPFDTNYDDPELRNPRVMNTTATLEVALNDKYTFTTTLAQADSDFLRTGGFSSTQWSRNWVVSGTDQFGRSILTGEKIDDTIGAALAHGSFGEGQFRQIVFNLNRRFADGYQFFVNYSYSENKDNAASERDTDSFFGPQDPINIDIDYGTSALDIPHQLKASGIVELPKGFLLGGLLIVRSGVPYPACSDADTNGDGVVNNGCNNDRPVVAGSSLLERYPARQPDFKQFDLRLSKDFSLSDTLNLEISIDAFNILNIENKYSNPAISSLVSSNLSSVPKPGDLGPTGVPYRTLDQVSPGSTPRAFQLGAKLVF
jgi:hypothetical protein